MMVAADRGGAAGKVDNFCCVCEKHKDVRGNIIFTDPISGEQTEYSHEEWT